MSALPKTAPAIKRAAAAGARLLELQAYASAAKRVNQPRFHAVAKASRQGPPAKLRLEQCGP
eukprot:25603-Chlamydomonas_euryale.AAC.1